MNIVNTDITIASDDWTTAQPNLESLANEVLAHGLRRTNLAPAVPVEISLLFCGNEEGRQLNKQYRDKDYATNVLSFAQFSREQLTALHSNNEPVPLGDIVLSYGVITKEAADQDKRLSDHVSHLLLHGLLHLLGFDHIDDVEAEEMETLEVSLLAELGVQNPYDRVNAENSERHVHG